MSWEHLSKEEKKELRRLIKLGEEAGQRLREFSRSLNKKADQARKRLKEFRNDD